MMVHNPRIRQALQQTLTRTLTAAIALTVGISSVSAQDARQVDLSAGYATAGSMHGVSAQVSSRINNRWSLVGEIAHSYGTDCPYCEPEYRDTAGLAGVQFTFRGQNRVSPFWQILAGGLHSRGEEYYAEYCCGLGTRLEPAYTVDYLALQPAAGLTAMLTRNFGVRAQTNFQFAIPDQSQWEGISIFPRLVVGGVIRLGR